MGLFGDVANKAQAFGAYMFGGSKALQAGYTGANKKDSFSWTKAIQGSKVSDNYLFESVEDNAKNMKKRYNFDIMKSLKYIRFWIIGFVAYKIYRVLK
ncbi:MAG: hypothetical protein ACTSUT_15255 [Promethearchaeota archaeon]